MPAMVMVPKIRAPNQAAPKRQQSSTTKFSNAYSLGEETFDTVLALDSPFVEKVYTANSVTESEDSFDPFHVGDVAGVANKMSYSSTIAAANALSSDDNSSSNGLIPPKMLVKFKIHEEVSSVASLSPSEGTSKVYVQGTIQAQVVSSDALKNSPFVLTSYPNLDRNDEKIDFTPNQKYTKPCMSKGKVGTETIKVNVVKIPKDIVGFVSVGTYTCSSKIEHMPLLLEQKVVRSKSKMQIAIQVRSKLTNPDDLSKFTIVVSIPARVNGNSVVINAGDGYWDPQKRSVTWGMDHLPRGQSFMVSVKCALDDTSETPEAAESNEGLDFPILLRCSSNDQLTATRFEATEATGYPATVSSSVVDKSFRIIHRLQ